MTLNAEPTNEMADVYVRLDFIWETTAFSPMATSTGHYADVAKTVENGSLSHYLYNVAVEHDSSTVTAGVVTTKEQIAESEVTAFQDELRRALMEQRDAEDPGEADTVHISSVHLGQQESPRQNRKTIDTHPALHCALRTSGAPNNLTAPDLEATIRGHAQFEDKRVDVRETLSGFNIYIRESTITRSEAHVIRGIIMRQEDVKRPETNLLFTSPTSGELPEPITGADSGLARESPVETE